MADDRPAASPESVRPDADAQADCAREKCLQMQAFLRAADGIRTHDLLHGKRNLGSRASHESPAKRGFPSYRRSAMLSSFCREIAGVSGLEPDSGPCRFGRRLRSPTVGSHPAPGSPGTVGRWQPADACSSSLAAVTLDRARVLRSGGSGSGAMTGGDCRPPLGAGYLVEVAMRAASFRRALQPVPGSLLA
jgi:hypothetical protein